MSTSYGKWWLALLSRTVEDSVLSGQLILIQMEKQQCVHSYIVRNLEVILIIKTKIQSRKRVLPVSAFNSYSLLAMWRPMGDLSIRPLREILS